MKFHDLNQIRSDHHLITNEAIWQMTHNKTVSVQSTALSELEFCELSAVVHE